MASRAAQFHSTGTNESTSSPAMTQLNTERARGVAMNRPIDLDYIDAVIHIFDLSIELQEIKARPAPAKHHAFRGQMTRVVLTTLRDAKKPLTTQDYAGRSLPAEPAKTGRRVASAGARTSSCCGSWRDSLPASGLPNCSHDGREL